MLIGYYLKILLLKEMRLLKIQLTNGGMKSVSLTGTNYWTDVACSGDGKYMYATSKTTTDLRPTTGVLYRSDDYGSTWSEILNNGRFESVAVSNNGQYVYIANTNGGLKHQKSNDYGITFTDVNGVTDTGATRFCAMSGDGKYIITGHQNADSRFNRRGIWTNNNYGADGDWTHHYDTVLWQARNAAVNNDGQYAIFFVTGFNGHSGSNKGIWLSNDYMQNWSLVYILDSDWFDAGCAISSSGQYMAVAAHEGSVYVR